MMHLPHSRPLLWGKPAARTPQEVAGVARPFLSETVIGGRGSRACRRHGGGKTSDFRFGQGHVAVANSPPRLPVIDAGVDRDADASEGNPVQHPAEGVEIQHQRQDGGPRQPRGRRNRRSAATGREPPTCGFTGRPLRNVCTRTNQHRCELSGKRASRASALMQVREGPRTGS